MGRAGGSKRQIDLPVRGLGYHAWHYLDLKIGNARTGVQGKPSRNDEEFPDPP